MNKLLNFLNLTNADRKISITNLVVIIFCTIVAFRTMFAGVTFNLGVFTWTVKDLDLASIMPMFFGLINYGHKRQLAAELNTNSNNAVDKKE